MLGHQSNLKHLHLIEMRITNTSYTFAIFALGLPHTGFTQQKTKRLNIFFVTTDQQCSDALRFAGNLDV
jgi:hypothetical protein